jgi:N-methylhydantoinase A
MGVDIGGTFTDIVMVAGDGTVFSKKLLSTPHDYSEAIESGVEALLSELSANARDLSEFVHATTVATNTIIERRGVQVALVTTRGFRDVLELGRFRAPRPYDMRFRKAEPLVPRDLRFEVGGRIGADGSEVEPLDMDGLEAVAEAVQARSVHALAVCFVNSYANDRHEQAAAAFLRERLPAVQITTSTSLMPQIGEFERTSTTVINAYIRPVVGEYVTALARRLDRLGVCAPLMIMQSSGGIAPGAAVAENPITIIESGPAAGVLGAQRLSLAIGVPDLIVFDMGGTTAKATIIEQHAFGLCPESEVGGGAALGSRMIRGAGYPVQVPTIDIAEVGAGGGSIAAADTAGGLKVGPRSAGAAPGPVCYGRGGVAPTVTDANLVLGYLNPEALVGGELALDANRARRAIAALGAQIDLDLTETAYGIHQIVNATMLRALKGVSSERGQDPSKFSLLAIGGNGPVHAAALAEAAGMSHVIVPPVAGLFSALGLLFADVEHQLVRGFYHRLDAQVIASINAAAAPQIEAGRRQLAREGYAQPAQQEVQVCLDIQYKGQTSTLTIPMSTYPASPGTLDALRTAFEAEHLRTFGYVSGEALQTVAMKVVCRGLAASPRMPARVLHGNARPVRAHRRQAYFGERFGWLATPVVARESLAQTPCAGPLIIEEYDTTVVVRPGWRARLDDGNNLLLEAE